MERIEEFTLHGKYFIYFDLSGFKTNDEFVKLIADSKSIIQAYKKHSLYTITNIEGVRFDTETKKIVAEWTEQNKPYVKHGVVIGMDTIKQMMVNAVFTLSGRKNMSFAATKEKAIDLLLGRV